MFEIKKSQSFNKTIRMPEELIQTLQALADENDISFNQLVVQCCEYAIANMTDDGDRKKAEDPADRKVKNPWWSN